MLEMEFEKRLQQMQEKGENLTEDIFNLKKKNEMNTKLDTKVDTQPGRPRSAMDSPPFNLELMMKTINEKREQALPAADQHVLPADDRLVLPVALPEGEVEGLIEEEGHEEDAEAGWCSLCDEEIDRSYPHLRCDACGMFNHRFCEDQDSVEMAREICRARGRVMVGGKMYNEEFDVDDLFGTNVRWLCRKCLPYSWEFDEDYGEGDCYNEGEEEEEDFLG